MIRKRNENWLNSEKGDHHTEAGLLNYKISNKKISKLKYTTRDSIKYIQIYNTKYNTKNITRDSTK